MQPHKTQLESKPVVASTIYFFIVDIMYLPEPLEYVEYFNVHQKVTIS
jgi:hypothetical protein